MWRRTASTWSRRTPLRRRALAALADRPSWAPTSRGWTTRAAIFLPAKFREDLAGGLVITRGQERCLYVFPEPEFARLYELMRQAPVTSKAARDYQRVFLSGASTRRRTSRAGSPSRRRCASTPG